MMGETTKARSLRLQRLQTHRRFNSIVASYVRRWDSTAERYVNVISRLSVRTNTDMQLLKVEHYRKAIQLDQYLAVAYFQQGVSNFLSGEFEKALNNFGDTLDALRDNDYIDYHQIGLNFKLHSCEAFFNRGLCFMYTKRRKPGFEDLQIAAGLQTSPQHSVIDNAIRDNADGYTVFSIPTGVVYRPSEARVQNAVAAEHLPRPRVITLQQGRETKQEPKLVDNDTSPSRGGSICTAVAKWKNARRWRPLPNTSLGRPPPPGTASALDDQGPQDAFGRPLDPGLISATINAYLGFPSPRARRSDFASSLDSDSDSDPDEPNLLAMVHSSECTDERLLVEFANADPWGEQRQRQRIPVRQTPVLNRIRIKLRTKEDLRSVEVAADADFDTVTNAVLAKLRLEADKTGTTKLKLMDEDGDLVTLADDEDWLMALAAIRKTMEKEGETDGIGKLELWVVYS
ncbi:hypothetical protein ANO11243_085870 [Dothideomycetidae sp. 11243]|nr:hypothetical protein ANO11243_085870 [fungal sp. No.11243]